MDKASRKNILLGFFVLIGLILFILGIFLIGSKSEMFKKTFPITAKFANATGLKAGSNVRYNGVNVGIVKSVTLINDTLVQVDMQIEESKRAYILKSAVAAIASDGLMGDKIVNLSAGQHNAEQVQNNDLILAHNPLNTEQVLETLSKSNENIKTITENLKQMTSDINANNGLIQSMYKDSGVALNMKQSFRNLDAITQRVLTASNSLQEVTSQIQNGNGVLAKIISDTTLSNSLSYTMGKLKETSDELTRTFTSLSVAVEHANSGKGALNMLLTDTAFSVNTEQSMINIKNASRNLNENMEALKHSFLTRGYFRKQAKRHRKDIDSTGQK